MILTLTFWLLLSELKYNTVDIDNTHRSTILQDGTFSHEILVADTK